MISLTLVFRSLRGRCYSNCFWGRIDAVPTPHFHNVLEYWNTDGCISTSHEPSTWDIKLVSFGPVTQEFLTLDCVILGANWQKL